MMLLTACLRSPETEVVVQTEYLQQNIPIQEKPKSVKFPPVDWYVITEENLEEKIEEIITKVLDDNLETDLTESQWFIKGDTLNPGIYCLTKDVVSMNTGEAIAKKNSKIRVKEHTEPYSSFLGNNIYKVQHVLTKQELYISNEDIKR